MSKVVKLTDEQVELYLPVLKERIKLQENEIAIIDRDLTERRKKLLADKDLFNNLTGQIFTIDVNQVNADVEQYETGWSLIRKIEYIISEQAKTLTVKEVFNRLHEIEPEIKEKRPDKELRAGIASSLANYARGKKVFYLDDMETPFKYGLLKWVIRVDNVIT